VSRHLPDGATELTGLGETTSTAIAAILFGLLKSPAALRKVTEEIRSSFGAEGEITVASTTGLHYLIAVVSEGMRLGPPSAITPPRIIPRGGAEICGKVVPSGVCGTCLEHLLCALLTSGADLRSGQSVSGFPLEYELR